MLTPRTANPENTVGLCSGKTPETEFMGQFDTVLLVEWAERLLATFGPGQVCLYSHKSEVKDTTARLLLAALKHEDDLFVFCAGCDDEVGDK